MMEIMNSWKTDKMPGLIMAYAFVLLIGVSEFGSRDLIYISLWNCRKFGTYF